MRLKRLMELAHFVYYYALLSACIKLLQLFPHFIKKKVSFLSVPKYSEYVF